MHELVAPLGHNGVHKCETSAVVRELVATMGHKLAHERETSANKRETSALLRKLAGK